MGNKATYVTERHTSEWFVGRLRRLFELAGVEVTVTSEFGEGDPETIVSGSWRVPESKAKVAVVPFNERPLPRDDWSTWKDRVRFFVSQAPRLHERMVRGAMRPSATVDHPLCWMPAEPVDLGDNRPIKFIVPCCGEWRHEHLVQLLPRLIASLQEDLGSLSLCEFVVDSPAFPHRPRFGERVTFYDDEGAFLQRLACSMIVCCMGPPWLMEMSFLQEVSETTSAILFSESLLDASPGNTPSSLFDALHGDRCYSRVKYQRAAAGIIQLDDEEGYPLFDFCSGSSGRTSTRATLSQVALKRVVEFVGGRPVAGARELRRIFDASAENLTVMSQKMRSVCERLSS
jgi:hypothetical protein